MTDRIRRERVNQTADGDGYGQSMLADIRSWWRFRACRRQPVMWVKDSAAVKRIFRAYPFIERFGDGVVATARVHGRDWIVLDRIWHGWPDPPEFAFFALADGAVWAAWDFHRWPDCWTGVEPNA